MDVTDAKYITIQTQKLKNTYKSLFLLKGT